jgi:hypothetical protein
MHESLVPGCLGVTEAGGHTEAATAGPGLPSVRARRETSPRTSAGGPPRAACHGPCARVRPARGAPARPRRLAERRTRACRPRRARPAAALCPWGPAPCRAQAVRQQAWPAWPAHCLWPTKAVGVSSCACAPVLWCTVIRGRLGFIHYTNLLDCVAPLRAMMPQGGKVARRKSDKRCGQRQVPTCAGQLSQRPPGKRPWLQPPRAPAAWHCPGAPPTLRLSGTRCGPGLRPPPPPPLHRLRRPPRCTDH